MGLGMAETVGWEQRVIFQLSLLETIMKCVPQRILTTSIMMTLKKVKLIPSAEIFWDLAPHRSFPQISSSSLFITVDLMDGACTALSWSSTLARGLAVWIMCSLMIARHTTASQQNNLAQHCHV